MNTSQINIVELKAHYDSQGFALAPGLLQMLFFNGTLVHGSFPNTSPDQFRRSLIGHYVEGNTTQLTKFDQPVLSMDGSEHWLEESEGGGECGVWVERDGSQGIEMSAHGQKAEAHG